jgi:predicted amidohydrolase
MIYLALLQFSPVLGAIERNMARATALLESSFFSKGGSDGGNIADEKEDTKKNRIDVLILPEMAFSGYLIHKMDLEKSSYSSAITSDGSKVEKDSSSKAETFDSFVERAHSLSLAWAETTAKKIHALNMSNSNSNSTTDASTATEEGAGSKDDVTTIQVCFYLINLE